MGNSYYVRPYVSAYVSTTEPLIGHISRSIFELKYTGCKLFLDLLESVRQKYGPVS